MGSLPSAFNSTQHVPCETERSSDSLRSRTVAVSVGDPSGAGPELIVLGLASVSAQFPGDRSFVIHCHRSLLEASCLALESHGFMREVAAFWQGEGQTWTFSPPTAAPPAATEKGSYTSHGGVYSLSSLDAALEALEHGRACALVTGPVNKRCFHDAGLGHMGHTEYLALRSGVPSHRVAMLLDGPGIRVLPLTRHIPISEICAAVRTELVVNALELLVPWLRMNGLDAPRVALACLDPHCGEWGIAGETDRDVAAWLAANPQVTALGPFAADTLFTVRQLPRYDAVLCWYHDQALIPLKLLAFDLAVNVSLGLPFLRTSPDHGPAYDLARDCAASPGSMTRALELAGSLGADYLNQRISNGSARA